MSQIETLARQAWQLQEQGYSIEAIADAMNRPTSTIERWLERYREMLNRPVPWHDGLEPRTVLALRRYGIDSRSALIDAWENGLLKRGMGSEIGHARRERIRAWLETSGQRVGQQPTKAHVVELSAEADAALHRLKSRNRERMSQVINRLLIEADAAERMG